jgi:beta-fructofuranosidase
MNVNRRLLTSTFMAAAFAAGFCFTAKAQDTWNFDGRDPLVSQKGQVALRLISVRNYPELTDGLKGKGLRTDGYTTWLSGKRKGIKGMSGWFALESFPTDTAAFFGVKDASANRSIAVTVDRFGELLVGTGTGNTFSYIPAQYKLEKFQWIHLALSGNEGAVELYVNGNRLPVTVSLPPSFQSDEFILGKDFREKKLGIHALTAINGIIDEVKVSDKVLDKAALRQEVAAFSAKVPVLAVPESRFREDFNRPKYHFLPAANWTNETHGLFYYKGRYHIFNQKNASNLFLGQINWGHFSSPDLVNWTEHKPALAPERGYDENGIWSGHVVLDNKGVPTIIYTAGGVRSTAIGLAFPKDSSLVDWVKYSGNPVIPGQPSGFSRTDLRDPYVFTEGNSWYMIIGYGLVEKEEKGTVLLYKSDDLKSWKFLHTLFVGDPARDNSGVFWEMPVFRKMNGKYVLLVNKVPHKGVPADALYWVGDFVNERFVPDNPVPQHLEVVNQLLSPSVAFDAEGRTTAIAIIPDLITSEAAYENGWTHVYSIPRTWTLKEGKICQQPHPVLHSLREEEKKFPSATVKPGRPLVMSSGKQQVEIEVTLDPQECRKFGFILGKHPEQKEFTKVFYDFEKGQFIVDKGHSSIKKTIPANGRSGNYSLQRKEKVNIRLFVDGSVVEVFINNEDAFTTRIFPSFKESNSIELFAEGGDMQLLEGTAWKLKNSRNKTDF